MLVVQVYAAGRRAAADGSVLLYFLGFLGLLAVVGLIWWWLVGMFVRWVIGPLPAMADAVRRLGPENLAERLRPDDGNEAFQYLADAINATMDRLAAGFEGQRRFTANASHELRTPLAVQRTLVEVALDSSDADTGLRRLGPQLLRTNERTERLIEGLLVLAESDRGLPGVLPVPLHEVVASVVDAHTGLAAEHSVRLRSELVEQVVPGDEFLLERLVRNLVHNAIVHNEPGGSVEIALGDRPTLSVRNSGPRIPAEEVSGLLEPFRRLLPADRAQGRNGSGLGLTIVRSVVHAHHGELHVRPGTRGGLVVDVSFPRPPDRG